MRLSALSEGYLKMREHKRTAYVNGAIIIINIVYFLYLELAGSSADTLFMLKKGAMYVPLIVDGGQYYRLLTCIFMHFGIQHLINNMLVLFILGDNLERALGRVKYLVFYLLCGVGANVFSMIVEMATPGRWAVSAGASGAIFGVVGGLIYIVGVNRGRLEDLTSRQLILLAVVTLYHGFTSTGVGNAAHVGGLIIGIFLGMVFYRKPGKNKKDIYGYE